MIKPLLQDSYDPATEADLERFEEQIGARLPEDYRAFLQKHNGGDFPGNIIYVPPDADYRKSCLGVQCLDGLSEQFDGLQKSYRILKPYLPKGFVPIADDGLGNQICIVVSGHDVGSIWLWDHEAGTSDEWPPENSKRITDSFTQFFNGIIYDPDADDEWTETIPAFMAAERGDAQALTEILDSGYDLKSRNKAGQTLLICAADNRQSQIVRLLLERGADVSARDDHGRTALLCAAWRHSFDSVKLLVAAGADLEAVDDEGNTPLLKAVPHSDREAFYLIEHGADVNAVNKQGYRPLQYCTGWGTDKLRAALIRAGADESLAKEPMPQIELELIPGQYFDDYDKFK